MVVGKFEIDVFVKVKGLKYYNFDIYMVSFVFFNFVQDLING